MTKGTLRNAMAAAVVVAAAVISGQANAGPSCGTGFRFGASKSAKLAQRVVPAPRQSLARAAAPRQVRVASAAVVSAATEQSGGDNDELSVVRRQQVEVRPEAQIVLQPAVADTKAPVDEPSISGIAARLAALAAQQAAAARTASKVD